MTISEHLWWLFNEPDPDCPDCRQLAANPDAKRTLSQWRQHQQWHDQKKIAELERLWKKT